MAQNPETDTPALGRLIANARRRQALTEREVAERVGVSRQTVVNWEHGKTLPPLTMVRPLADVLEIGWRRIARAREHDDQLRTRIRLLELPDNA